MVECSTPLKLQGASHSVWHGPKPQYHSCNCSDASAFGLIKWMVGRHTTTTVLDGNISLADVWISITWQTRMPHTCKSDRLGCLVLPTWQGHPFDSCGFFRSLSCTIRAIPWTSCGSSCLKSLIGVCGVPCWHSIGVGWGCKVALAFRGSLLSCSDLLLPLFPWRVVLALLGLKKILTSQACWFSHLQGAHGLNSNLKLKTWYLGFSSL